MKENYFEFAKIEVAPTKTILRGKNIFNCGVYKQPISKNMRYVVLINFS